ncbi:Frizzled [Gryllus bimaculatus]|nr:Frizzled [Gryllus bimaculatus]
MGAVVLWVVMLGVGAGAVTVGGGGGARCERITVSMCHDVGYNLTAMPNMLGHEDQLQADREMSALVPLLAAGCGGVGGGAGGPSARRLLRIFLCAAFAPLCTANVARPVPACRGLCEAVAQQCAAGARALSLNCAAPAGAQLLALSSAAAGRALHAGTALPDPARPPILSAAYQATRARVAAGAAGARARPRRRPRPSADRRAVASPAQSPAPAACPAAFARVRRRPDGLGCAPRCGRDAFYRPEDKRFAETWMTGWAWLCFLSTLFTLLTFWVEPARFRYPERPVVFLALSYNLLALAFVARGALGAAALSCVAPSDGAAPPHLAQDGLDSGACTLSFLALYYFGLASGVWWLVLCACWFLSAAKQWSCEALQGLSTYFHVAAWATPAILGLSALVMHHVAADELTGLCQVSESAVGVLVVLPQGALLVSGCVLAALGGASLVRVRGAVRAAGRPTAKLERLMTRLGVFAALYAVPVGGALACALYEAWHRPRWRSLALLAALDCQLAQASACAPAHHSAGVEVALLRLFLSLVVGVTSGMWVWSGKTCRAWSRLFTAPRKPRPPAIAHQHAPLHVSRKVFKIQYCIFVKIVLIYKHVFTKRINYKIIYFHFNKFKMYIHNRNILSICKNVKKIIFINRLKNITL